MGRGRLTSDTGSVLVCQHTSMMRTIREWSHAPQLSAAALGAGLGLLEAQPVRRKDSASAAATARKSVVHTDASGFNGVSTDC